PLADARADQRADERRRTGVEAERVLRAHVLRELALERQDLVRALADAVVAEEVLALDHPTQGLELFPRHLHPTGEHRRLGPCARRSAPIPGKSQVSLGARGRRHAGRPFWT